MMGIKRNCTICVGKRISSKNKSRNLFSAPNNLISLPHKIFLVHIKSKTWKKLEHMQANEAFSFKNDTFFFLCEQKFDEVVDQ